MKAGITKIKLLLFFPDPFLRPPRRRGGRTFRCPQIPKSATSEARRRSQPRSPKCDLGGSAEVATALSKVRPRRRRGGRRRALPRAGATSAVPRRSQTRSPACRCDLGGTAEVADALSRVPVRPRRRRGGRRRAVPRAALNFTFSYIKDTSLYLRLPPYI